MIWLLLLPLASAQGTREYVLPEETERIDAQLFQQSLDALTTLWTNDASMRPNYYWTVRAGMGYVRDPLVYQWEDGASSRLLRDAVQLDLAGTIQLWRFRLGIDVPIFLFAAGDPDDRGGAGLGGLLVDLKGTILDHDRYGVGLALAARTELPTQTMDVPLGRGTGYEFELIVDGKVKGFVVAANVGHRGVPRVALGDQVWDDQLTLKLGMGYMFEDKGGVSLDIASATVYGDLFGRYSTPVEGMVGGWARVNKQLVLRGGVGTGFTSAVGSPMVRTIVSLAWEPSLRVEPPPEPPPPEPPPPLLPPAPGKLVIRTVDIDGNPVDATAVVTHLTVAERATRPDGPSSLQAKGGVGSAELVPGRVAVVVQSEGYLPVDLEGVIVPSETTSFTVPMTRLARKVGNDRITISEQVFFDLAMATIKPESFQLLREVAFLVKQYPQIGMLRIEGHTDSRGSDEYNFSLSNDRAESVLEFLVAQGVERSRLNAIGYGERRPLDPRENDEAWALNRRVDFFIERWDPEAPEGGAEAPAPSDAP
jgi:outer membrane protein OmpA-like peptidoglycan-associated protein